MLPWLDGRWAADLFHPETLRDAGARLGKGAAIGAGVGLAVDAATAGLSLGAAAAFRRDDRRRHQPGFGPLGRRVADALRGANRSLEDSVLLVAAQRLLGLHFALQARGHAAEGRVELERHAVATAERLSARSRRAHPEWLLRIPAARAASTRAAGAGRLTPRRSPSKGPGWHLDGGNAQPALEKGQPFLPIAPPAAPRIRPAATRLRRGRRATTAGRVARAEAGDGRARADAAQAPADAEQRRADEGVAAACAPGAS